MDANLLACPDHENLIEQLIRSRAWVDFSQGLDIRLVNRDNAVSYTHLDVYKRQEQDDAATTPARK